MCGKYEINTYACMYVCMYVFLYVCMSVCTYVCMSACMHACMHACMYVCVCMCMCVYVCMCVCVCTYIKMYIYIYNVYVNICIYIYICIYLCVSIYIYVTNLVLGSRSVGFTSATFFSQSKMSQSSLTWDILNTVQGRQCHIVFEKHVQNCSTWPKLARQKCSKLREMTQAGPKELLKIAQTCWNYSKFLNIAQDDSKCLKLSQNGTTSV